MQKRTDWSKVDFGWNRALAFLVTAEEGSFSAAARALQTTQSTIGRQITALEEDLGVTLFERVSRGVALTETGVALLEHVRAMGEAAIRVSRVAAGQSLSLEGLVRIAASEVISAHLLPPVVAKIRSLHPNIEVGLVASNDLSDLHRREADIAIRNVRPSEPDFFARKLPDRHGRFYASSDYLARLGPIESAAELSRAHFIAFENTDMMIQGLERLGVKVTQRNFPVVTSNHLVQWELAKQGQGICIMMEEIGEPEPRVHRVLPGLPPIQVPMWLVSHRELHTSRRVRVVFDLLAEALGAAPA